ncbi:cobalamin-dependent protein, partial [Marinobacter sp.]
TGLHRTPEEVVDAAIQEDVDILGISLLSGAHMHIFPKVLELLKDKEAEDMIVAGGGVIPDDDVKELYQMGVHKILLQDTPPQEIIDSFRQMVADRGAR